MDSENAGRAREVTTNATEERRGEEEEEEEGEDDDNAREDVAAAAKAAFQASYVDVPEGALPSFLPSFLLVNKRGSSDPPPPPPPPLPPIELLSCFVSALSAT